MTAAAHPEKARALLERPRPEPRHLAQLCPRAEPPVLGAVLHDAGRERLAEAGDVSQELHRGGVHVDADARHAALDDLIERALQRRLMHVVLVLPDADRLRIDLHELGQRVLQATTDGDRAAHGDVFVRQLFARDLRRRVHRRARLVHHDDDRAVQALLLGERSQERLGLARRGAVADRDGLDAVTLAQRLHRVRSLVDALVRLGREDDGVLEQRALGGERRQLAAGAEAGVDREHTLAAERRCQQQVAQVLGEHADGLAIGALLHDEPHVDLDGARQEALPRVLDGEAQLAGERRAGVRRRGVGDEADRLHLVDLERHAGSPPSRRAAPRACGATECAAPARASRSSP